MGEFAFQGRCGLVECIRSWQADAVFFGHCGETDVEISYLFDVVVLDEAAELVEVGVGVDVF